MKKPKTLSSHDYGYDVLVARMEESDRGQALLLVSFLEGYLEKYLKSNMVSSTDFGKLFTGYGPLSGLSSKIEIAYSFGLLSKVGRHDFHLLRKVRNHFAHYPLKASLRDQSVRDLLKNLAHPKITDKVSNPEARLILPVSFLVADVDIMLEHGGEAGEYSLEYCIQR